MKLYKKTFYNLFTLDTRAVEKISSILIQRDED